MNRTAWLSILAVISVAAVWFGYGLFTRLNATVQPTTPEGLAALRATITQQNESAIYRPPRSEHHAPAASPLKNVYFGDLHVHTELSFDSYIFGNRLDPDSAYRIAKGESMEMATGERVELTRPLDFVALTDHAEGFGIQEACARVDRSAEAQQYCNDLEQPSVKFFLSLRNSAVNRPITQDLRLHNGDKALARAAAASTWAKIKQAAERHNEPGTFTAFAGYEYSPVLPDRGKHHRNVIFRSSNTPDHAVSAYDAASEIDLWRQLEASCTEDCQFLTIPHNPNKTWGLAFASQTIDGLPYSTDDWALRERSEPIVEMFQIKGNSECSQAFGAGDEECGFEQFLPACPAAAVGQENGCIYPTSMVRDGLQKGLALAADIGSNPLQFGFIGSTDTHNSNPGDAEEWDFRGASGFFASPANRRLDGVQGRARGALLVNPGGLAAVWARENTREALFDAMRRKEVYATSGTRIKLRVFAGFDLPPDIADTANLEAAYDTGVPMGGSLQGAPGELALFVWAVQDPDHAPLAKVQVIKGALRNGTRHEIVHDIACGGATLDPATGQCQPSGAAVDMTDCSWPRGPGAAQLKTRWVDPDFRPNEDAFYYVRVVQNPTCRWSTYDSIRLGRQPPQDVPATVTEMAWASPIWVQAGGLSAAGGSNELP